MKLAIHYSKNSFSERWINYCNKEGISYKLVNPFDTNIIEQVKDCDALFWHHSHGVIKDVIAAKKILFAIEHAGIKVFPDYKTAWHFDDKVAQKYLLEAINAPLVPSFIFYDKMEALRWVENTTFPKVFKLKGGASSSNVKLVNSRTEAKGLIRKAFGKGFAKFNGIENLRERIRYFKAGKEKGKDVLRGIKNVVTSTPFAKVLGREKGYIYFQEFIPNNLFDIRIIVIKDKAFAIKRMVRSNDFRASGSGNIVYDETKIDIRCLNIAFETNKKLNTQSIAFDFVFDVNNQPLIVEISYGFAVEAYDNCTGYWDNELNWYAGKFNPQEWMIENLIKGLLN